MSEIEKLLEQLALAVIDGKKENAIDLTNRLLELNHPPKAILDDGLLAGMDVVGVRFRDNMIFVPQVLISARAMKSSLAILEPLLSEQKISSAGTIIIGTVKGDIHDIGKNIVSMMLRSNGFKVVDLGIDTSADKYIEIARSENADIIGMSALLTTTMTYMKTVIEKIKESGIQVKTIVGGAPISKAFADQVGADGYAQNATEAVELVRHLLGIKNTRKQ